MLTNDIGRISHVPGFFRQGEPGDDASDAECLFSSSRRQNSAPSSKSRQYALHYAAEEERERETGVRLYTRNLRLLSTRPQGERLGSSKPRGKGGGAVYYRPSENKAGREGGRGRRRILYHTNNWGGRSSYCEARCRHWPSSGAGRAHRLKLGVSTE